MEHSAGLLTCIKVPHGFKTFVSSVLSGQLRQVNIGLKNLLQQGISEPIFYGDLVYKFKRIVGKPNFSDQFKKIVKCYIRVG